MGALAAALTVTQVTHPGLHPPPNGHQTKAEDPEMSGGSTCWPSLSPEVEVPPLDSSNPLELPQAWKAVRADFSKPATRPQLRQWLGPQGWKLDRGINVGL